MNIILFSPGEVELPLPRHDVRARHILNVLRRKPEETFDVGLINGPRGKATLKADSDTGLELFFVWEASPPPLAPIRLIVGLPRPQTARDVLRESASLGVSTLDFVSTNRSETSYAQSSLWSSDEAAKLLVAGAAQAFCTHVPELRHGHSLAAAIALVPPAGTRIALDNYEATGALSALPVHALPVTIAIGAERGWSDDERSLLRANGFALAHLGARVLRTETACIAAITLLRAKLGLT